MIIAERDHLMSKVIEMRRVRTESIAAIVCSKEWECVRKRSDADF